MNWFSTNKTLRARIKLLEQRYDADQQRIRDLVKKVESNRVERQYSAPARTIIPVNKPKVSDRPTRYIAPVASPAPAPAPYQPQAQSSSGTSDFLMGAVTGIVIDEIFSRSSEPSSAPDFSSDGGGDFGGGGASSDW